MSTVSPDGSCTTVTVEDDGSAVVASCNTVLNQTVSGGGVSDGDKGDITVSGSGATWTIDNDAVTFAKMQNIEEASLIGREYGAGTGDPKVIKLDSQFVWTTIGGKPALAVSVPSDASKVSTATLVSAGTGLSGGGALSGNVTLSANFGTTSGSVCQGNDSRLSDPRTPTAHKSTHATGQADALSPADIGAAAASHTHAASDIASGTIATARLGSGTAGSNNFLRGDQTWASVSATFNPATKSESWSDFIGNSAVPWATLTNGTGASVAFTAVSGAANPGVATPSTGSTATGRAGIGSLNQDVLVLGTYSHTLSTEVVLVTDLSTAAQRYIFEAGFMDGLAGPTNGVYFRYSHDINSGKWECVCIDAGGTTTADSGITVAASTWYRLEIDINAGGTSAVFKIDGTTVATITNNIPNGTGERVGILVQQRKTDGTTARSSRCDYLYHSSEVTR